ncbi:hypothetical protein EKH77_17095 [Streptomyces luteoverticillatus]|uniref:Molecular chaperone DnaJ n=1 Tax=Streptomyces luteoverticillatus TaxID=66425 RepID=A0A3Q9FXM2_STRLT|nr:hypothetical protein EKH77_17095 [Streptomyces luteoverticillatus]
MIDVATRKSSRGKTTKKPCPVCSEGRVSETFKVGGRKKLDSPDRQEALCLTCMGSGEATD